MEYGALVILSGALIAAIIAAGFPSAVTPAVSAAVCELYDAQHCDPGTGGPDNSAAAPDDQDDPADPDDAASPGDPDGSGDPNEPGQGDPSGPGGPDGGGGPGGSGDPEGSGDPDGSVDPGAEPDGAGTQPASSGGTALDKKIADAQKEYDELLKDHDEKKGDAGKLDELLLELLKELIGYNDAKACFTEGDVIACLSTALEVIPWTKAAKFVSKIPKAYKLFDKWRTGSKAFNKVKKQLGDKKKKLDDLKKKREEQKKKDKEKDDEPTSCPIPPRDDRKTPNSFVPGTPVLLADGSTLAIEDVDVGDEVLAFDPRTGEEGPRPVTDLIEGAGKKTLVKITVTDEAGATGSITATDEHPFWSPKTAEWIDAEDLIPGTWLRTSDGDWARVTSADTRTANEQVHNLSVADLNTYYVKAGTESALVHNDGCVSSYSNHARERMDERGISEDMVEQTVARGKKSKGNSPGTTKYKSGRMWVIVNRSGNVVSVGRN